MGGWSGLRNPIALLIPKIEELVLVFQRQLNKKRCRKLCEAFAHPLSVIGLPTHHVPPTLMCDLMRSDIAEEIVRCCTNITARRDIALRGIHKRRERHVDKCRPRLAKISCRLLRKCQTIERQLAEIYVVD